MARKKSSKNNSTTQTAITGNVNIKIISGKRVIKNCTIHNCATDNLFYGLILALTKNLNSSYLPTFIGVGTGTIINPESTPPASKDSLVSEISMNRPLITLFRSPSVDRGIHQAQCTFQGIVPYAAVGDQSITEVGIFGTQTGNSLLARIEFDGGSIELQSGQSLVVEWTFSITNSNNNYKVPLE